MKKSIGIILGLFILALLSGCGKTGVDPIEDATDIDAIINIIRYDYAPLFIADTLELPAPDTSMLLAGEPYQLLTYWRTVNWDSLFITIGEQDTVLEDSSRIVPFRAVAIEQFFRGNLEIIALDTSNGGSERVRLSKPYSSKGTVPGIVKKYGFDYNSRRGWRLTEIGNTIYGAQIGQVKFWPADHPEDSIAIGIRTYPFSVYPSFADGESLIVSVRPTEATGGVAVKYTSANGSQWLRLNLTESGAYEGGFKIYDNIYDKHFVVDMVRSNVFEQDTTKYFMSAIGVLYNIR